MVFVRGGGELGGGVGGPSISLRVNGQPRPRPRLCNGVRARGWRVGGGVGALRLPSGRTGSLGPGYALVFVRGDGRSGTGWGGGVTRARGGGIGAAGGGSGDRGPGWGREQQDTWVAAAVGRGYWGLSESRRWPNSARKRSISGDRAAVGTDLSEADRDESTSTS